MIIGTGIDLVEIDRLQRAIARHPRLETRLFTAGERQYAGTGRKRAERLAVRFAAKEACLKALGIGLSGVSWQEVEVVRSEKGTPSLLLSGRALGIARQQGVTRIHLSLSHVGNMAVAQVVMES